MVNQGEGNPEEEEKRNRGRRTFSTFRRAGIILTFAFRRCCIPFAVVITLQYRRAHQLVTRVAVVFDARVDVKIVTDHVTAGGHFGLLTGDHCVADNVTIFQQSFRHYKYILGLAVFRI